MRDFANLQICFKYVNNLKKNNNVHSSYSTNKYNCGVYEVEHKWSAQKGCSRVKF